VSAVLALISTVALEGFSFQPVASRRGQRFDATAADRPVLVLEGVVNAYRADSPVLRGLSLSTQRGEFVFVTGPSGPGQGPLLRLLYAAAWIFVTYRQFLTAHCHLMVVAARFRQADNSSFRSGSKQRLSWARSMPSRQA
jgi:ATPase subunit of ABC transporter with duplicated ATPase domains